MRTSIGRSMRRLAFVGVALLLAGLAAVAVALHFASNRFSLPPYVVIPHPPLPPVNNCPCIESALRTIAVKRNATLDGPDWKLETSVDASCLPERSVTLSYQVSRLLVNRNIPVKTHMLVSRRHDRTFVRIVDSSGDEKQDMIAVGLVTNQKCTSRNSMNCEITGGPRLVKID
jgi:hypothetical protein